MAAIGSPRSGADDGSALSNVPGASSGSTGHFVGSSRYVAIQSMTACPCSRNSAGDMSRAGPGRELIAENIERKNRRDSASAAGIFADDESGLPQVQKQSGRSSQESRSGHGQADRRHWYLQAHSS